VLRRRDLHSTRLTLVVPLDGVEHLVTLEEESLSLVPAANVPANTFVPEPTAARAPLSSPSPSRSVATPSLEVRLVELIDRVAPRESLSVRQTDTRAFLVEGLVSTADRRRAVLDGIAAFRAGGGVSAEIVTFEEAARDQPSESANGATRAQVLESTVGAAPVESWVRARVAPDADPMASLRELTPLVMTASGAIRRHALALSALTDRFDEATVAQLDEDGRAAWRTLLERHAAASLAALNSVDTALAPYFDRRRVDPEDAPETPGMAAHRLVDVAGAIDRAIVAAFATSRERSTTPLDVLEVRDDIQNARALAQIIHALASSSRHTPREIAP
jgi:hypothetical protein